MRTFKTIFLTLAVLFAFTACKPEKPCDCDTPPEKIEDGTYVGLLSVENSGNEFQLENIHVVVEINEDNTLNFTMMAVKFAQAMPVTIDMNVAGVTTSEVENGLILSGDNIVPTAMMGTPFPQYTITELSGTLTTQTLEFSMICGGNPVTFSGEKVNMGLD